MLTEHLLLELGAVQNVPGEPATDEEWLAHRDDPIPQILTPALFHALDHYNLQLSLSLRQLLPPGEPRWCHTYTRLLSLLEPEEWSRMERLQRRELACFVRDGGETCSPEEWQERAYAKWRYEERVKRCCTLLLHFRQYVKLELDAGSSYEEIWQRLAPFEEDELPTKAERDARQLEIACIAEEEALRREEAIRREKEERDGEVERARSAGARRRPVALKRMQI
ncbi:hypothetical protein JCM8097_007795 [Rhodosporidiobolus ruineniae]